MKCLQEPATAVAAFGEDLGESGDSRLSEAPSCSLHQDAPSTVEQHELAVGGRDGEYNSLFIKAGIVTTATRGKQGTPAPKQQQELRRMSDTGKYSTSDLAELFSIARPTGYRTIARTAESVSFKPGKKAKSCAK